jgi:hypothetical protein
MPLVRMQQRTPEEATPCSSLYRVFSLRVTSKERSAHAESEGSHIVVSLEDVSLPKNAAFLGYSRYNKLHRCHVVASLYEADCWTTGG